MAGKCDDKQQYKEIIEAAMVSASERFTDKSIMSYGPYVPLKQPNARKSLCQFSETFDSKTNTDVCRVCDDKSKRKAIIPGRCTDTTCQTFCFVHCDLYL